MIKFKHKELEKLYEGKRHKLNPRHVKRLRDILAILDHSQGHNDINDTNSLKFNLHKLKGPLKNYYSVSVSGNWRVTFRFENKSVVDVNYVDYHGN